MIALKKYIGGGIEKQNYRLFGENPTVALGNVITNL